MIVGYSRNPKKFKLNQYTKTVPVKQGAGYYLNLTAEEAGRIINSNLNDFYWADGEEAPMGNENTESFQFLPFATRRYVFPFNLGAKAVEQATWEIVSVHAGLAGQRDMTARTQAVWNVLNTSGNWAGNTDTATNLAGGQLDSATTSNLYIKKLFRVVAENILKATLGVVQREDLVVVMSPHTAGLIAESQEIVQHLVQSPFALAQVRQDVPNQNGQWGLPDVLYGVRVCVEDAVKVTSKKLATRASGYVCPAQTMVFMARPGGLMGMQGIPEFSTIQGFMYEESTVETKFDSDNRRHAGRVVSDFDYRLVAPATGYLVTACTAS